jgi:tetratricopeptide (TPR) repeat protein
VDKLVRAGFVAAALVLAGAGYLSATTYYGRFYDVMASRGVHGEEEYERNLRTALAYDDSYGYGNIKMAALMMRRGADGLALVHQERGMRSFNSVRTYAQLGSIQNRLGRLADAGESFERAAAMYPGYIDALEQLALLAYRAGDSNRLQELTAEIRNRDINNLDAYYLRAKDAERVGNTNAALLNYQLISASLARTRAMPAQSMFDRAEIESRLKELGKAAATQ